MEIAIIDDDRGCVASLKKHIERYAGETGCAVSMTVFENGLKLIEQKRSFDILFLDIDMPIMNGLEAARLLRKQDETAVLIFVTSLAQYALKGYTVNALDFMVKPVSYESFRFTMTRAIRAAEVNSRANLVIETRDGLVRDRADRLLYVEVSGHTLIYHFADRTVETRGRLADAESKLSGFLKCNNCYLVNPRHIRNIQGYELTIGENVLTISHPRRKQFMEDLGKWYAVYGG